VGCVPFLPCEGCAKRGNTPSLQAQTGRSSRNVAQHSWQYHSLRSSRGPFLRLLACRSPRPTPRSPPPPPPRLYSSSGLGTYYFDVRTTCPQDTKYPETDGYPACASWDQGPNQQTLRQINSNNM
jgi:hypothetical protein